MIKAEDIKIRKYRVSTSEIADKLNLEGELRSIKLHTVSSPVSDDVWEFETIEKEVKNE